MSHIFKGRNSKGDPCVFLFLEQFSEPISKLQQEVSEFFSKNLPEKEVLIILPPSVYQMVSDDHDKFLSYIVSAKIIDPHYVKAAKVVFLRFEGALEVQELSINLTKNLLETPRKVTVKWLDRQLSEGFQNIFFSSTAVMDVREGEKFLAHFEKPTGDHVTVFVRTANAISSTCTSRYLALLLILRICYPCRTVLLDSPTILSLGLCVQEHLATLLPDMPIPVVKSFDSYRGLQELGPEDLEESLAIVSASSGGGLERELVRISNSYDIDSLKCITIAVDKPSSATSFVVCLSDEGVDLRSFSPKDCPLCTSGVPLISIASERFVPSSRNQPAVLLHHPVARDSSSRFQSVLTFLEHCVGKGVLRCFYAGSNARVLPFYFFAPDEAGLLRNDIAEWLRKECRRYVRDRNDIVIVSWKDDQSKKLTEMLKAELDSVAGGVRGNVIEVEYAGSESGEGLPEIPEGTHRVFIVQSASQTSKDVLSFASSLKQNHVRVRWHYVSLLSKGHSHAWIDQMKSNLKADYGSVRFHDVSVLWEVPMESINVSIAESFEKESALLTAYLRDNPTDVIVAERVDDLCKILNGERPEQNRLFFSPDQNLAPGGGLMFWPEDVDPKACTHADLLWTFHCLLHHFRLSGVLSRSLSGLGLSTLSVRNFYRFYDGAAQAAVLRSAYASELNYLSSDEESTLLYDLLSFQMNDVNAPHSSGLYEFLLALASGRMQARPSKRLDDVKTAAAGLQGINQFLFLKWLSSS